MQALSKIIYNIIESHINCIPVKSETIISMLAALQIEKFLLHLCP